MKNTNKLQEKAAHKILNFISKKQPNVLFKYVHEINMFLLSSQIPCG